MPDYSVTECSQISPSTAARELLRRRGIRRSFTSWCEYALEPFGQSPQRHHRLIISKLEGMVYGKTTRLMILAPPGSAKSTYPSPLFPPWLLAARPRDSFIAASHTAELAERFGRKVRNLVSEHAQTLGIGIAADNAAAGRWETTSGGEYFAIGVGGAVAGRRADWALIDDPVKSRAEADSELIRDRIWEWGKNDMATRLKPDGRVVLIMCMVGGRPVVMADGTERP